jgi:hypothetical protein
MRILCFQKQDISYSNSEYSVALGDIKEIQERKLKPINRYPAMEPYMASFLGTVCLTSRKYLCPNFFI